MNEEHPTQNHDVTDELRSQTVGGQDTVSGAYQMLAGSGGCGW